MSTSQISETIEEIYGFLPTRLGLSISFHWHNSLFSTRQWVGGICILAISVDGCKQVSIMFEWHLPV